MLVAAAALAGLLATLRGGQPGASHLVYIPSGSFIPPENWTPGTVAFDDRYYSPSILRVKVGSVVRWVNRDSVTHTVTLLSGPEGGEAFNQVISPGRAFEVRLTKPGEYVYHCAIHPWQFGKVVVEG